MVALVAIAPQAPITGCFLATLAILDAALCCAQDILEVRRDAQHIAATAWHRVEEHERSVVSADRTDGTIDVVPGNLLAFGSGLQDDV